MDRQRMTANELRSRQKQLEESLGDLEFEKFAVELGCDPERALQLHCQVVATGNELASLDDELKHRSGDFTHLLLQPKYVENAFNALVARF